MNTTRMHEVMTATLAGEMIFPQVVGALAEIGVESYRVDFLSGQDTFYLADGQTHTESTSLGLASVAETFSDEQLTAAIRGAQADT
ncbi:MAG: hypothetical protein ABI142_11160, partial [Bryocella sp.]